MMFLPKVVSISGAILRVMAQGNTPSLALQFETREQESQNPDRMALSAQRTSIK
jgi:hypothetical protein